MEYHGEVVPADVEALLHKADVFILPSKSENFGHVFYEALSAGKPVITSHTTPWKELLENKAGLNVNPDVNEITESILFFVGMHGDDYMQWSNGAVKYAEKVLNIDLIKEQYHAMFSLTN